MTDNLKARDASASKKQACTAPGSAGEVVNGSPAEEREVVRQNTEVKVRQQLLSTST